MSVYPSLLVAVSPHEARLYRIEEGRVIPLQAITEEKDTFSDHEGGGGSLGGASEPDMLNPLRAEHLRHHLRRTAALLHATWSSDTFAHLVALLPEQLKNMFHN